MTSSAPILIVRPKLAQPKAAEQTVDPLKKCLEDEGLKVIQSPVLTCVTLKLPRSPIFNNEGKSEKTNRQATNKINCSNFDAIILTSAQAAASFAQVCIPEISAAIFAMSDKSLDPLGKIKAPLIKTMGGSKRRAHVFVRWIEDYLLKTTLLPETSQTGHNRLHFLFPCGRQASHVVEDYLSKRGHTLTRLELYDLQPTTSPSLPQQAGGIVLTSPSSVRALFALTKGKQLLMKAPLFSIGPTTSQEIYRLTQRKAYESSEQSFLALAKLTKEIAD